MLARQAGLALFSSVRFTSARVHTTNRTEPCWHRYIRLCEQGTRERQQPLSKRRTCTNFVSLEQGLPETTGHGEGWNVPIIEGLLRSLQFGLQNGGHV